ncbi:MAG: LacI family DNA-binding transcriptional regulator [Anaerolineales bacterium]
MDPKPRITIKDVARAEGVSTHTVSRVLNERPDVSSETRMRVQQVIAELGYSPNVIARNLSRGRSNTLGVIGYGLIYFGSSGVIAGIESKANELGYSLTRFSDVHTPIISINMGHDGLDHVVALDNRLGGKLATEHLLQGGYQDIGIITGPRHWWEAKERLMGWQETVEEAGYSDIDRLIVEGDWNAPSGDVGLHSLLDQNPEVDAVFVSNDQMALGSLQAARRLGLKVPEDLGIVGFDDIPEAAYFYPSLTTVRQNTQKLGAMAVDQIHALIQVEQHGKALEPEIAWVKPRLIVRKSSVRK